MKTQTIFRDGTPVPDGMCIMPDNTTTNFVVSVRSLLPVQASRIKAIIEQYYEVAAIEMTERQIVVQNAKPFKRGWGVS